MHEDSGHVVTVLLNPCRIILYCVGLFEPTFHLSLKSLIYSDFTDSNKAGNYILIFKAFFPPNYQVVLSLPFSLIIANHIFIVGGQLNM